MLEAGGEQTPIGRSRDRLDTFVSSRDLQELTTRVYIQQASDTQADLTARPDRAQGRTLGREDIVLGKDTRLVIYFDIRKVGIPCAQEMPLVSGCTTRHKQTFPIRGKVESQVPRGIVDGFQQRTIACEKLNLIVSRGGRKAVSVW